MGLINDDRWQRYTRKMDKIVEGRDYLEKRRLSPSDKEAIAKLGLADLKNGLSLVQILRRPDIHIEDLVFCDDCLGDIPENVRDQLQIEIKYEGYIARQHEMVERFRRSEQVGIPSDMDYSSIEGLSIEVREKLQKVRPQNLGQAARIPGVTPAAVAILSVLLRRN